MLKAAHLFPVALARAALRTRSLLAPLAVSLVVAAAACSGGASPSDQTATAAAQGTPTLPASTPTPPATATPAPAITPTTEPGLTPIPDPPERDLYELARQLKLHVPEPVNRQASPLPTVLHEGDEVTWTVNRDSGNVKVNARVWRVTANAYWLFEDSYPPDPVSLANAVNAFENGIWPTVTSELGHIASPGVDGDPRLVIFHGRLRSGVAGYFNGGDEYPVSINPNSNEREVIYMSVDNLPLGARNYLATLAHELQHAVHWADDPGEESWVNEGLSEVSSALNGYPPGSIDSFLRSPDTSLLEWEPDVFQASPNYGASALFFEYLAAHYGGTETLRKIIEDPADGIAGVDAVLRDLGFDTTMVDVFSNWVVANYADDDSGPYSYPDEDTIPPTTSKITDGQDVDDSVRPFGTNYYVVNSTDTQMEVSFEGADHGQLFPAEPYSGDTCWWSNAGDSIDSTLSREIDLTGVSEATLHYQVWYSIEEGWDFAYITVSTDGGNDWQVLPTERSSTDNPNGTSFGPGLSGDSEKWVEDSVDLSQFAGKKVLLSIQYITDDAIHGRGACFDDFSIPELDWTDDTSTDGGWEAAGFVRINDRRPVQYAVQVIRDTTDGPAEVTHLTVGSDGKGSVVIDGAEGEQQIVIAVSAVTPDITGSLDYTLSVSAK